VAFYPKKGGIFCGWSTALFLGSFPFFGRLLCWQLNGKFGRCGCWQEAFQLFPSEQCGKGNNSNNY
jgi:hypothetical protein